MGKDGPPLLAALLLGSWGDPWGGITLWEETLHIPTPLLAWLSLANDSETLPSRPPPSASLQSVWFTRQKASGEVIHIVADCSNVPFPTPDTPVALEDRECLISCRHHGLLRGAGQGVKTQ